MVVGLTWVVIPQLTRIFAGWLAPAPPPQNTRTDGFSANAKNQIRKATIVEEVRAATRDAWKRVADEAGIPPPLLDDLLWELGREDPDLVGADAGELREPPRRPGVHWY